MIVLGLLGYAFGIDPRLLIGGAEMVSKVTAKPAAGGACRSRRARPRTRSAVSSPPSSPRTRTSGKRCCPAQTGVKFKPAPIVLFNGATQSACGTAQSAMGPFYCPLDKKIYLDTSFFKDMQSRFGGGGDFAYAYVISHEMGHHIQDLLGILPKAQAAQQRSSKAQANAISVRIELQADCLAGVWAANANQKWQLIEQGDVEKAIKTAQAIGDDRLQQSSRGFAVPDSFTHGSSAQRVEWLERGLQSGKVSSCNTFAN